MVYLTLFSRTMDAEICLAAKEKVRFDNDGKVGIACPAGRSENGKVFAGIAANGKAEVLFIQLLRSYPEFHFQMWW
ncbi:MAG: hypothetical protein R2806_20395 [Saprospiraceae bacterium]